MKTTIINLYGGPGCGKSTSAAYLYYLLKVQKENVELVREYVKDWAWDNRKFGAYDEIYFLGKQVRHESMLFGKVDYIVTDAPVYMTAYYASIYCSLTLSKGVLGEAQAFYQQVAEDGHQHLHIMLNRIRPYAQEGRYQNESQAHSVDDGVGDMLRNLGIRVISANPDEASLKQTLEYCQNKRRQHLLEKEPA
jgi:AAA domain